MATPSPQQDRRREKKGSTNVPLPGFRVGRPRGQTTIDARKHMVEGNTTRDESMMLNHQGRDTWVKPRTNIKNVTNIRITRFPRSGPKKKYRSNPSSAFVRSSVDIESIAKMFRDETGNIIRRIHESLTKCQISIGKVTDSLEKLEQCGFKDDSAACIDSMLVILKRPNLKNLPDNREYRAFGFVLGKRILGESYSTRDKRVRELLQALEDSEDDLFHARSRLNTISSQPKPEDKKCQKNIRLCYDDLSSLDRNHNRFRELFDKHVSHLTSLIRDLNEQEKQELALLISCRHMSTVLCRQLGSLCDEHDDHQVYVNLEKIERRSEGKCQWISFELAFQRCDQEEQGFVLIHAEIMVNEDSLSNSFTSTSDQSDTTLSSPHLQTPIINPVGGMNHERACFCIGSLANGMNFRFKIGTGTQVQQCPFPGGAGTSLLSLAEWIRQAKMEQKDFNDSNIDRRVRLACLVAEAVLKFEIALWSPEILTSQTIMLAADGTHMRVCLAQQRYLGSPSPRQPSTVSKILQSLGVVLLELGLLEVIPENVLSRGSNELIDNLEDEMGRHYTAVVRFCIGYEDETDGDNSLRDKGIYDLSIQEYFYQRVIRLLKANDNLVEQYANSRG